VNPIASENDIDGSVDAMMAAVHGDAINMRTASG
jgi:hypothetical protein